MKEQCPISMIADDTTLAEIPWQAVSFPEELFDARPRFRRARSEGHRAVRRGRRTHSPNTSSRLKHRLVVANPASLLKSLRENGNSLLGSASPFELRLEGTGSSLASLSASDASTELPDSFLDSVSNISAATRSEIGDEIRSILNPKSESDGVVDAIDKSMSARQKAAVADDRTTLEPRAPTTAPTRLRFAPHRRSVSVATRSSSF